MQTFVRQRVVMALTGFVAGLCLYILTEVLTRDIVGDRAGLALATLTGAFFAALLAMIGPLAVRRAAMGAAGVAVVTAVLLVWASFRFDEVAGFLNDPVPLLAAAVLCFVPLPFFVAASGPGWRDYPELFLQSWTLVVRYAAAWLFVGVVWGVIWLSDALLSLVGLDLIALVIDADPMPWMITGTVLGLALAVVNEMADIVSPYLVLRLLRLLLPVVLVVMVVFLVALPVQGLSGLFGGISAAFTLLVMCGAAATLVTTAIDQSDAEATQAVPMQRAAQGLALVLPFPAGLAAFAIWLRVEQHGWTPDRLFAATVSILALGYGISYAVAVLRGRGWMARVRQANVTMALALIAAAVVWLTPVLDAQSIAARSQIARFEAGVMGLDDLDLAALDQWGRAGTAARARLDAIAASPGQEALAKRLAAVPAGSTGPIMSDDAEALLADLRAVLPLQPLGATATRDVLLSAIPAEEMRNWLAACRGSLPDGRPGCVMVVADLWTDMPGEEAIMLLREEAGFVRYEGLGMIDGVVQRRSVWSMSGALPDLADGAALIGALQTAPPTLSPAPLNRLGIGGGLVLMP
ncbi:MAG: DUF4153 domain-containing protein [Pseudomonadota bacterium]